MLKLVTACPLCVSPNGPRLASPTLRHESRECFSVVPRCLPPVTASSWGAAVIEVSASARHSSVRMGFLRQISFSRKRDVLDKTFKKVAGKTGTVDANGLHKVRTPHSHPAPLRCNRFRPCAAHESVPTLSRIATHRVAQAICATGTEPPPFDELPALLARFDDDSDGRITLGEFKRLIEFLSKPRQPGDVDIVLPPVLPPAAEPATASATPPADATSPKAPPSAEEGASAVAAAPPAPAPDECAYSTNYTAASSPTPASPGASAVPKPAPLPAAAIAPQSASAGSGTGSPHTNKEGVASPSGKIPPPSPGGAPLAKSASAPADGPLPEGWEEVVDELGRVYYWHVESDRVLWTFPTEAAVAAAAVEEAAEAKPAELAAAGAMVGEAAEEAAPVASGGAEEAMATSEAADDAVADAQSSSKSGRVSGEWPPPAPSADAATIPASIPASAPADAAADAAGSPKRDSVKGKADFFATVLAAAESAASPESAPSESAPASAVGSLAKKFANATDDAPVGGGGPKGQLGDKMRQLQRAGVADSAPSAASVGNPPTQHKVAMAALERKAERANAPKSSSSQHAAALRGLQQAEAAATAGTGSRAAAWQTKASPCALHLRPAAPSCSLPVPACLDRAVAPTFDLRLLAARAGSLGAHPRPRTSLAPCCSLPVPACLDRALVPLAALPS